MVLLKILTTIQSDKMIEFEQAVNHILDSKEFNQSNLHRSVYREWQTENQLLYVEEWNTMSLLKKHLSSDLFKSLFGAMKVLGEVSSAKIIRSGTVHSLDKFMQ
jgi:quinol monooxygenase YgiN